MSMFSTLGAMNMMTINMIKPYWSRGFKRWAISGGNTACSIFEPSNGGIGIRLKKAKRRFIQMNSEIKKFSEGMIPSVNDSKDTSSRRNSTAAAAAISTFEMGPAAATIPIALLGLPRK